MLSLSADAQAGEVAESRKSICTLLSSQLRFERLAGAFMIKFGSRKTSPARVGCCAQLNLKAWLALTAAADLALSQKSCIPVRFALLPRPVFHLAFLPLNP